MQHGPGQQLAPDLNLETSEMAALAGNELLHQKTHLFMIRVWSEDLGNGKTEWRGELKHVLSGKAMYFREWAAMLEYLKSALPEPKGD